MRKGYDSGIIKNDAGKVVAINLGSDHCAEHEWGIKETRHCLGIDDTKIGLAKRMITNASERLVWNEGFVNVAGKLAKQKFEGFWLKKYSYAKDPGEIYFNRQETLSTAWSDGEFGAFSTDEDQIKQLREIYDALTNKDAAIWLGGGGVFKNAGLVIGIVSKLSDDVKKSWENADLEREKLLKDAAATGIEERLRKAKREFLALSPRRHETDGSVVFWLNPFEQDSNNFGWYTVKDLDDWIVGKGPIPKDRSKSGKK